MNNFFYNRNLFFVLILTITFSLSYQNAFSQQLQWGVAPVIPANISGTGMSSQGTFTQNGVDIDLEYDISAQASTVNVDTTICGANTSFFTNCTGPAGGGNMNLRGAGMDNGDANADDCSRSMTFTIIFDPAQEDINFFYF